MIGLKTWAFLVTAAHFAVVLFHGTAHQSLHIDLTAGQLGFVLVVIVIGPLVSAALMYRASRVGPLLLMFTMLASLSFGIYFHFIANSADNVSNMSDTHSAFWAGAFNASAYLLAALEALGGGLGALLFFGHKPANGHSSVARDR